MKNFAKAAIVAFGVTGALAAVPASAQPYDPYYDQGDGYYDDEAYPDVYADGYGAYDDQGYYDDYAMGYCDEFGCPDDFYDLPVFYGDVYYDGSWLTGPLYYRDLYGRRQFWIHGGWRDGNHRGGRFGPALGRNWYLQNRGYRNGFTARNAWRGNNSYRQRNYGQRNYGQRNYSQRNYSQRDAYRQRSFGGSSNFTPNTRQNFRGNNDWRSNWSNRQGFGQNAYGQRGGRQRDFSQGRSWRQNQSSRQAQSSGDGGRRNWGGRGDGGGRGDRGGDRGGRHHR